MRKSCDRISERTISERIFEKYLMLAILQEVVQVQSLASSKSKIGKPKEKSILVAERASQRICGEACAKTLKIAVSLSFTPKFSTHI